jgi:hypothetical protein
MHLKSVACARERVYVTQMRMHVRPVTSVQVAHACVTDMRARLREPFVLSGQRAAGGRGWGGWTRAGGLVCQRAALVVESHSGPSERCQPRSQVMRLRTDGIEVPRH